MSLTITTCKHSVMNIEGENVCRECGKVLGYDKIASINDKDSHNIGMFGLSEFYSRASNMAKNLNLPQFAIQTIVQTAIKLHKKNISKNHAVLFATIYSCRLHQIPRLLEDVFQELENTSGKKIRRSEKSLLRLLNKISKNIDTENYVITPPDKYYYLQAYLAKIQHIIIKESGTDYFETIRSRSNKTIQNLHEDPCSSAKKAILCNTTSILRAKVRGELI